MISFNTDRAYSDNDPAMIEVAAMHWAMKNKVKKGIKKVIFESDNFEIINMISGIEEDIPRNILGMICCAMWKTKTLLERVKFKHTPRENNQEAHFLARVCVTKTNNSRSRGDFVGPKAQL